MNRFYIALGLTILGFCALAVALVSGILTAGGVIHGNQVITIVGLFGGCITLVAGASILHEVFLEDVAKIVETTLQRRGLGK